MRYRSQILGLSAAAAVCISTIGVAAAADWSGDCCADLEERIAELEATTVRKGNRKVSLTLSGIVNEQVMYWDDGFERNVYQNNNSNISSRFRFKGSAKISADASAGFYIELQVFGADSLTADQNSDDGALSGVVSLRQSNWWLQSKQFGRITVGQGSPATDDIILAQTAACYPACFSDHLNGAGFRARRTNGDLTTVRLLGFLQGSQDTDRINLVRYDTPTFAGAKIAAAWGEDDFWDVAVWWKGDFSGFRVIAQGGYLHDSEGDGRNPIVSSVPAGLNFEEVKGSASIMHVRSGLFLTGAYVHREWESTLADFDYWYVSSGIQMKIVSLGNTVFYGEYTKAEDGMVGNATLAGALSLTSITESEIDQWGVGVVQSVDAASMRLYLGYKQFAPEAAGIAGDPVQDFEDVRIVFAGGMISF